MFLLGMAIGVNRRFYRLVRQLFYIFIGYFLFSPRVTLLWTSVTVERVLHVADGKTGTCKFEIIFFNDTVPFLRQKNR